WNRVAAVGAIVPDASGSVPGSITSLRLSWSPSAQMHVDAWLRHTAARPGVSNAPKLQRQAFNGLDVRLAWTLKKDIELSLTGQNLNRGTCAAYAGLSAVASIADLIPTCQPRSLTAQLRVEF
ncbi:MAG: hypothetical protein PHU77_08995, partial [Simplicispira sp.]|nr:hypothetical protein [Simplicispira sp.]